MDTDQSDLSLFPKRNVAKNIQGTGWRVWNRDELKYWGGSFVECPTTLLAELDGPKRPEILADLGETS